MTNRDPANHPYVSENTIKTELGSSNLGFATAPQAASLAGRGIPGVVWAVLDLTFQTHP